MDRPLKFSRREKLGIFGLALVIFSLLLLSYIAPASDISMPHTADSASLAWLTLGTNETKYDTEEAGVSADRSDNKSEYSNFDPNALGIDGFEQLGFSHKQSEVIVNYRGQYGPFRSKADFGKIYVVRDEKFAELEPYIQIDESRYSIEINAATAEELQSLKGIGPKLADRIIKYRKKLGGFFSVDQLKEVYGLAPETIDGISNELYVDTGLIELKNINLANQSDLESHPYFDFAVTALILKERNKHKLIDLNFLQPNTTPETIEKMLHYIEFE